MAQTPPRSINDTSLFSGSAVELSVIIPVYYGEKTVGRLVPEVCAHLSKEVDSFEIVLVNDGSTDGSDARCRELVEKYQGIVRYLELAKNFSEHNAVMAGLNYCTGLYAVIIDDDFQNPPSEMVKLYHHIRVTGADVVYSRYAEKKHSLFRNLGSKFNDRVATLMLQKPRNLYLSSFKILRRNLINEVIKYTGPLPYIDGLILRSTQHIDSILVEHASRSEGKSNYTLRKLVSLWSNMFVNFSLDPLRVALYLGMTFSVGGFVLAACFLVERLENPSLPLGWASLMICFLMISGVQLLILGIVGEFVGRLYLTETKKPQYVVRELVESKEATCIQSSSRAVAS